MIFFTQAVVYRIIKKQRMHGVDKNIVYQLLNIYSHHIVTAWSRETPSHNHAHCYDIKRSLSLSNSLPLICSERDCR